MVQRGNTENALRTLQLSTVFQQSHFVSSADCGCSHHRYLCRHYRVAI